ncbi:MAG TPA: two-component regulator propeller domain-containing protein [Opitutaceae bacterium]
MQFSIRRLLCSASALFLIASVGTASTAPMAGHSLRIWRTEDGLPQNTVVCAVQTHDGYLWFGTSGGLVRFDGERFRVFDAATYPELQDSRISRLFEDASHTLWIAHETGVITQYKDNRFKDFTGHLNCPREDVIGLGADDKGRTWAMREQGAVDCFTNGQRLKSMIAPAPAGIMSWAAGPQGQIWLSENGRGFQLSDGALTPFANGQKDKVDLINCLASSRSGGVWVIGDGMIRRWNDGHWVEDRGSFPWPSGSTTYALELSDGTLAVGTIYSGVYLIFSNRAPIYYNQSNGLPQNWIRFLYEDREGDLWVGTGSAGLVALHRSPFSVLKAPDNWQGCSVLCVAPGKGNALWIGTEGAGLYRYSSGEWKQFSDAEGLTNRFIWAVSENAKGETWAGNYWPGGPYRLQNGQFTAGTSEDARLAGVLALEPNAAGRPLVGTRDGMAELTDSGPTYLYKKSDGTGAVCAVVRDQKDVVWFGVVEGGLGRLYNGKLTMFHRSDGLPSEAVQCLFPDKDGTLWIGTADGGLARFEDGAISYINADRGLVDNSVCGIIEDNFGFLWVSTRHGIQRILKRELSDSIDSKGLVTSSQIFDHSDGLPTSEFSGGRQATVCKTDDGMLWFASSKGVVTVDPAAIRTNPNPPPVVIESLLVDTKPISIVDSVVQAALPPSHNRLEFRFAGLSYVAPAKVLFKYRLDGLDKDWVDSGNKRSAFYSHLSAGKYTFRVIACNDDGVWNQVGASLAFIVTPFYWQTWWFASLCSLGALAAAAGIARYFTRRHMQRQMAEMERRHAIERERSRIAQDIHDDVGASLSRIAMLSQASKTQLSQPEGATTVLSRIYSTAREVTRSLDEIVWAVDPSHDTLDSLADYMGKFAQNFLASAGIRCRLELPVQVPAWPLRAEIRHNLFLAFKEALNNAVKHAGATEIYISLTLLADSFGLIIKDNGRGLNAKTEANGEAKRIHSGNGLLNMQKRLGLIGGRCEISSNEEGGTTVSFTVEFKSRPTVARASIEDGDGLDRPKKS